MDILRFATAGSVDDGKSTLIGRLLYDSKALMEDQLENLSKTSSSTLDGGLNLALLTDGLKAEREQGITIDVAWRYFSTPKRKFIIADTPGHVQHTRNMVTGISGVNLVLILVDARNGVSEQTKRHALISSLMGIDHLILCINKMDLVNWDEARYESIKEEFLEFGSRLGIPDISVIPISALHGDNIVNRSPNCDFYDGLPLIRHLEEIHVSQDRNLVDVRFAVQLVIRPISGDFYGDYRGYAGNVLSGCLEVGDEILVLPSGFKTKIKAIDSPAGPLQMAYPPLSATLILEDDIDIARGDMICRDYNRPIVSQDLTAMVCWLSEEPLRFQKKYILKHTTRTTKAIITDLKYRMDVNTSHRDLTSSTLKLNDIGRIDLRSAAPIFYDDYKRNKKTGSFILIDPQTNWSVAAGMFLAKP